MKTHHTFAIIVLSGILLFPIATLANNAAKPSAQFGAEIRSDSFKHNNSNEVKFAKTGLLQNTATASARQELQDTSKAQPANNTIRVPLKAVEDKDQNVYFNHFISDNELTAVDTSVNVIDTYSYAYKGRIFTNKVVK